MFSGLVSKGTFYGTYSSISKWLRRGVFFALVLALTSYGIYLMYGVLLANGMTLLEFSILLLFSVTFAWISIAFCSASTGFVLNLLNLDPLSPGKRYREFSASDGLHTRTAVVMPVYNEEPSRVIAGLEAVYTDLELTGEGSAFDFYLLSDSTDPEIAAAEETQLSGMKQRLSGGSARIFYRRRKSNTGRKAGNIADFCCRWGAYYDYMVVLDADSVMAGRTLNRLVMSMQTNPDAGIIQTVPIPVRRRTVFGRFLQFASALYSPMISAGMCFWQAETSNYWGHNAIIRVKAFLENCGLPELSGEPPLGGEILSHDFVEAALMRRGGWHTYMISDLGGSYEEVPANILDYAKRDRRWVEGNLQHIRLLNAYGLHPLNRLYFALGALAYCSSLLWLLMLILSTVDAVARAVTKPVYFGSSYQLFPDWPVSRADDIFSLLGIVVAMLIVPKIMGVVICLTDKNKRSEFGGTLRLLLSSFVEMIFAVLVAPLMMCFHALFVIRVLSGRNIKWEPQNRGWL